MGFFICYDPDHPLGIVILSGIELTFTYCWSGYWLLLRYGVINQLVFDSANLFNDSKVVYYDIILIGLLINIMIWYNWLTSIEFVEFI